MKIKILLTGLLLLAFNYMHAAPPAWSVNPGSYNYNMTVSGVISLDYIESADPDDIVGAFIGGECRGTAKPYYQSSVGRYIVYLMIYSNDVSGTINFKVYDASEDAVTDIPVTMEFAPDEIVGSAGHPYFWSNPTLSSESLMSYYSIPGQTGGTTYDGMNISLEMPYGTDLTDLVAAYTVSDHALVKNGDVVQESEITHNDFTSPLDYWIQAADETSEHTYTISVTHANYVPSDITLSTANINETQPTGTIVGTLTTEDYDNTEHTYTLAAGAGNVDNGLFTINNNELKTNTELDFEAIEYYSIRLQTDDGDGGTYQEVFIITVIDENDETPVVTSNTITLPEDNALESVHDLIATDADANADFRVLEYLITAGNDENKFSINSTTGVISLIANLDFETTTQYILQISVTDGVNTGTGNITVNVTDVNDETPVVTAATENILETLLSGEQIHEVIANDPDVTPEFGIFQYSITAGNTGNAFSINETTGIITLSAGLDYETVTTYNLEISVSDGVNTGTGIITIALVDVNDEIPLVVNATINVNETSVTGTEIHTVEATDADANSTLSYSIVSGNTSNTFNINSATGIIQTASSLDYESTTDYSLGISVTDGENTGTGTITVLINDENDELPVVSNASAEINETASLNTELLTVQASDADAGTNLTYSITGGNDEGKFYIYENTGLIKLIGMLDFESVSSYSLEISVSDAVHIVTANVNITVIDQNDETPQVTDAVININETLDLNTQIHTVTAVDADANSTLTYSIASGNTGNAFTINANTAKIETNALLDYETLTIYNLQIEVFDGVNTGTGTITVNIIDENDETPEVTQETINLPEDTELGAVYNVTASDADINEAFKVLEYSIASGNDENKFNINAETGEISLIETLDFESITLYYLEINVSDGVNTGTGTITVNVTETNDEVPQVTSATENILETMLVGEEIHQIVATDGDAGTVLSYSITGGNTGNAFAVSSSTGMIILSSALDYETITTYELEISASDGLYTGTGIITINLVDVNDETPQVSNAAISVNETTETGTEIHTVTATDADANSELTYSIVSGNTDNAFSLNSTTGVISTITSLDYENTSGYNLNISVSDGTNTGTGIITISVNDENDEVPLVTNAEFSVAEDATVGSSLYFVEASDADAGSTLTYYIQSGNSQNKFAINAGTGEITLADELNYELAASYQLEIRVNDGINNGFGTMNIEVIAVNDEPPVVSSANVSLSEDAVVGQVVHTVEATDPDNSVLTYSITGGNTASAFAIHPDHGIITVIGILDYETSPSYSLEITVDDGIFQATGTINISLLNVNDEVPIVTEATVSADEDWATGVTIHDVEASDPDGTTTLEYSIIAGNAGDAFIIEPNTGIISLNNALDYENIQSYQLEVSVFDGVDTGTGTITVNVNDVNDEVPVVNNGFTYLPENTEIGTEVFSVIANDADVTSVLSYNITGGNSEGKFNIDAETGIITLAAVLDYENTNNYILDITVSDGVNSGTGTITIEINDVNDEVPIVQSATITIAETENIGNVIYTVEATDQDQNSELMFSISDGNYENIFAITQYTGVISLINSPDYETTTDYMLQISVSDGVNIGTGSISVQITDVNDESPEIEDATVTVPENEKVEAVIYTVNAQDADANSELSYSITEGNSENKFYIDTNKGDIKLRSSLKYEETAYYDLEITVSDGLNTSTGNIYINVSELHQITATVFPANNAFSPNGDGVNDYWEIKDKELYENCEFYIYDHMQNLIYQSTGYNNDWDGTYNGKELPTGTYYYYVKCTDCVDCQYSGTISIIR